MTATARWASAPPRKLARSLADSIPAVVVAEIEGDGMHGYDLCASIKKDERLRGIPVIQRTRSAYPSDYANAHAVGAIICMAKPFKQEKLGHMVRLLAPLRKKAHLMQNDTETTQDCEGTQVTLSVTSHHHKVQGEVRPG